MRMYTVRPLIGAHVLHFTCAECFAGTRGR